MADEGEVFESQTCKHAVSTGAARGAGAVAQRMLTLRTKRSVDIRVKREMYRMPVLQQCEHGRKTGCDGATVVVKHAG